MIIHNAKELNGFNRWRARGDDVMDVAHWIASNRNGWKCNTTNDDKNINYHSRSWTLGHSFEDVQRLACEGWSDGALDLSKRLLGHPPALLTDAKWRYDVVGERPDIGRFLSGDPANMMRHGHPKGRHPVIGIAVNVWIRADVNAQHMANYGAALVSVIDRLEQAGRRVEVTAMVAAPYSRLTDYTRTDIMSASWTVKRAEDSVDLGALAFSLAHPGASRRFGWAVWERFAPYSDSGYGAGVGYRATLDDLIDPAPNTLILTGLNSNPHRCATIDDALKFVAEQINEAAGEALVEVEG